MGRRQAAGGPAGRTSCRGRGSAVTQAANRGSWRSHVVDEAVASGSFWCGDSGGKRDQRRLSGHLCRGSMASGLQGAGKIEEEGDGGCQS